MDCLVFPLNWKELSEILQERGRALFLELVSQPLEEENQLEFKKEWIEAQKLAKIMLGMANLGGGIIIFGVEENANKTAKLVGLSEFKDKAVFQSEVKRWLPQSMCFKLSNYDFSCDEEKSIPIPRGLYQVIFVCSEDKDLPYLLSGNTGSEQEGSIFIRRGTQTVLANREEINAMVDKKINALLNEKSNLELEEHLRQLYMLYENKKVEDPFSSSISGSLNPIVAFLKSNMEIKKDAKKEYNNFLAELIEKKQNKIKTLLNLS